MWHELSTTKDISRPKTEYDKNIWYDISTKYSIYKTYQNILLVELRQDRILTKTVREIRIIFVVKPYANTPYNVNADFFLL